MAFWRRIADNVFGETGPPHLEVTSRGDNALIRLPNECYSRERTIPWMLVTSIIGSFAIVAAVRSILDEDLGLGQPIVIGIALAAMAISYCACRIRWHFELLLSPDFLRVDCFSTFNQVRIAEIELEPIRQLTLVRSGSRSSLQVESITEAPVQIFALRATEEMREVARLIVEHHSALAPNREPLRISEEVDVHLSADVDRAEPPLNTRVELGTSRAGLSFDFPLPDDARPAMRKTAWRLFEVAIFILMGAVIGFAVCTMIGLLEARGLAFFALIAGLFVLMAAGSKGVASWKDHRQDSDLRQISVLNNMLVRTTRDHHKQIWYAVEIRTIHAAVIEHPGSEDSPTTYTLDLVVELYNGDKSVLATRFYNPEDYRPKAEYEWLATKLRHALAEDDKAPANAPPPSTAIMDTGRTPSEERITPTEPASPRHDSA